MIKFTRKNRGKERDLKGTGLPDFVLGLPNTDYLWSKLTPL